MGLYKYIKAIWQKPKEGLGNEWQRRLIEWRKGDSVVKVERPTRLDRARTLGYKAKQGIIVARARISRGGRERPRHKKGRKPSKAGFVKFTPKKSRQLIAEERTGRKYPNMEVLNSYYVAEDGKHLWYEVILVDPSHNAIIKDKDIGWIANGSQTRRVHRGLTSAGKKARGLRTKGTGAEKARTTPDRYKTRKASNRYKSSKR